MKIIPTVLRVFFVFSFFMNFFFWISVWRNNKSYNHTICLFFSEKQNYRSNIQGVAQFWEQN